MRVLLVNPNRLRPPVAPIAIEYLASALSRSSHQVAVADLGLVDDPAAELDSALSRFDAQLVGVTVRNSDDCFMASGTSFLPAIAALVARIREGTAAPIVLGGAGFSAVPGGFVARAGADYGIRGDGEGALPRLATAIEERADPSGIPGLVVPGRPSARPRPAQAPGFDSSGPLRWEWIDVAAYFQQGGQAGVETKRGCSQACVYCADPLSKGTRVRPRPIETVAAEVARLVAAGIDHLHLCDAEINAPPEHLLALCQELVRHGLGERVRWYGYATPLGFSAELARWARRAGCAGIDFGSDSGDDRVLASLGRSHSSADVASATRACREEGIAVMHDLLLGGPGETHGSIARTIELMKRLQPTCVGVSFGIRLYPGTRLAQEVARQGPLAGVPGVRGAVEANDDLALPVFFVEPGLGDEPERYVADLIDRDPRFFFGGQVEDEADYNYNDNERLTEAIRNGARGAYWRILAGLRGLA